MMAIVWDENISSHLLCPSSSGVHTQGAAKKFKMYKSCNTKLLLKL